MFVVVGVGEDLPEVRVAPGAAAVLWRAGALRDEQGRVVGVGLGIEQIFDGDRVPPVVAEVVGVAEATAEVDELAERTWRSSLNPSSGSGRPKSCSPKENAWMR